MSLDLYLNAAELEFRKGNGFEAVVKHDGRGNSWIEHKLNGEHIFYDNGRWKMIVSSDTKDIPASLKDLVEEISLYDDFPILPPRERGEYHHKSATAELETGNRGGKEMKHLAKITGKELPDARELLQMIKAGTIRPAISYDGPQSGLSRDDLERELGRLQAESEILKQARAAEEKVADELRDKLWQLVDDLQTAQWPFGRKMTIADQIEAILS